MAFRGPAPADFANVVALNEALLDVIAAEPAAIRMPAWLAERLAGLDTNARRRLARAPILLLSVGEADVDRWAPVLERLPRHDLLSALNTPPPRVAELTAATLGFLWQLACRDAYAVRVVSGASIEWCEALKGALLVDVLDFGSREPALVTMRNADAVSFWERLLEAGTSDEKAVRKAARLSALQAMLTGSVAGGRRPLRAAACAIPRKMRVAERGTP